MDKQNQISYIFYALVAFLNINETVLFWFCVIMGFDMLLGAVKSVVVPELNFNVKLFFFGALRKIALITLILFMATLGKGLGFEDLKMVITVFMRILMVAEGISVLYCFKSIWNKKEEKPSDLISKLIDYLIKKLGIMFEKLIKIFDDKSSCF